MPLSIVSFLIALFQLFHFGGAQLSAPEAAKNTSIISSYHSCTIHVISAHKVLRGVLGDEENISTEQDFSQALKTVPPPFTNKLFLPLVISKSVFVGQYNSYSDSAPLFVLHCNFRV